MDYPAVSRQPFPGDDGGAVPQRVGYWTIINTPVDALPDLSDVQVIIKTSYPGQAPQIVENQVTYPLDYHVVGARRKDRARIFSVRRLMYMLFLKMVPICTGPDLAFWNTLIRFRANCLRG
jgi:hypothetical protein